MLHPSPVLLEDARCAIARWPAVWRRLEGTRLLLTGASGFLGAALLDYLTCYNDEVASTPVRIVAVDNFLSGLPERIAHLQGRADLTLIEADMGRPLGAWATEAPFDWIIHGASIASPPFYRRHPLETLDANVNGTRSLLELARGGCQGVVVLSTSEIYGDPAPEAIPTPEDYRGLVSCTGPRACYDESKRLAETLCWIYHQHHQVPVKTVRPFNVYGPGQRLDDGRIIPDMLRAALAGGPLVLHSDGTATRAFCYQRDALAGLLLVLVDGQPGEAYNLGNDAGEVSMRQVAECVARLAADPPLAVQLAPSTDPHYLTHNPQRRCPRLGKLRGLAGWTPEVGLEAGLTRTLRAYRAQGG